MEPMENNLSMVTPYLKRIDLFLEDMDWSSADQYCEKVLDIDPENAHAYVGKLLAQLQVRYRDDLKNCSRPFADNSNYKKAIRFGDEALKAELQSYLTQVSANCEAAQKNAIYANAIDKLNAGTIPSYQAAIGLFSSISGWRDSDEKIAYCREAILQLQDQAEANRKKGVYTQARAAMTTQNIRGYQDAATLFAQIPGWKDADAQAMVCRDAIVRLQEISKRKSKRRKKSPFSPAYPFC